MLHDLTLRTGCTVNLPYELEREIFEVTARAYPKFAPRLTVVATHVQKWVEAIIYETIVLTPKSPKQDLFLRTFSSRPAEFFSKNIRNLHLASGVARSDAQRVFTVCTNLESLTCWSNLLASRDQFCALLSHNLRRLSLDASILWSTRSTLAPDLTHPVFSHITHLEVVNPPYWFDWASLLDGSIPHLTHLALGDLTSSHADSMPGFLLDALASVDPHLEMLIAVSRDERFLSALERAEIQDPRFACLSSYHHPHNPTEYWDGVARKEIDFWRRRDDIAVLKE
ncbi:hypothetical protein C8R47DRAFT_966730 [Mycena vitilis]|nr:hypothetical protein C8R47DRAFT_966730 [Mycena vitilis]